MNRIKLVGLLVLVPGLAFAQTIINSRHDLSVGSTAAVKATGATNTQTCIFCHTPHRSNQQALIWNHAPSAAGNRGWTATATTSGTPLPTTLSAVSMRCLSCHDATTALGDVSNIGGGAAGVIPTTVANPTAAYRVGNGVAGNEMLNNHPVSIPYAGATYNTVASGTTLAAGYQTINTTTCASNTGVCTNEGTNGVNVVLYGTGAADVGIECGSCHEPHNKFPNPYFLRAPAASSAICIACHIK